MPMYEYQCRAHGVFEAVRSLSEAAQPEPCPACGASAKRILSAPRLAQVGASERIARDRNEKSRHEPRLASPERRPAPARERPPLQASHGSRPWVLEHG
jgi:putative FmdB family regulatory protein